MLLPKMTEQIPVLWIYCRVNAVGLRVLLGGAGTQVYKRETSEENSCCSSKKRKKKGGGSGVERG